MGSDTAEPTHIRLVRELLRQADTVGLSRTELASRSKVSRSAIYTWPNSGSPSVIPVARTGTVCGLRLDSEPVGGTAQMLPGPPEPVRWQTNRRAEITRGWIEVNPDNEPSIVSLQLISAELHWIRTQRFRDKIEHYWGNGQNPAAAATWRAEHLLNPLKGSRGVQLQTLADVAARCGLRLVWLPLDAPWRRRPWERDPAPTYQPMR